MTEKAKVYSDKDITEEVGKALKSNRMADGYSLQDVADMTGFSKSTIVNIEKGVVTNIHYYVAFGQSVKTHVLNNAFKVELKPRYELSEEKKNRAKLTLRVRELEKANFFITERTVRMVIEELEKTFSLKKVNLSSNISRVLLNLVEDGVLIKSKVGKVNVYKLPQKKQESDRP